MFDAYTYKTRREILVNEMSGGIALFLGNIDSSMNYKDNIYPFRQDSSFLYYFGMDYPNLLAIIDLDSGEEILFGNDLNIDEIVWMGTQPTLLERSKKFGIQKVEKLNKIYEVLKKSINSGRAIHFLPPYRPEHYQQLNEFIGLNRRFADDYVSEEFIKAVVKQREIKSAEEIKEIDKAVQITCEMHLAAMKMARPGIVESEIAAEVQKIALSYNGNYSFPTILTVHGETLHNHYHGNILESGQLVLHDSGAETMMHYAGDMSRTFPVDKKFTAKQKEIYDIALNAHNFAIEALKPGVEFKSVHLLACRKIAKGMKELGLMKGDLDEAIAQGAHAMFFPCGLGHMMGLDVHDMENLGEKFVGYGGKEKSTQFGLKSLRLAKKLEAGMVLTIEPGIYFIPELIDLWKSENKFIQFINYEKLEEYRNFGGLRSEEDFVITENGYQLLGKAIPKTTDDIEALRS